MKIHVMSDLHFEHMTHTQLHDFWDRLEERVAGDGVDTVILAGDIGPLHRGQLFTNLDGFTSKYKRVFYTPGNHEFFGTSISRGHELLRDWEGELPRLRLLLPKRTFVTGSGTVTGGTLWYPDCGDTELKRYWIDYNRVSDGDPEFHVEHQKFLQHMPGDIVVSHHFPTEESVAPAWRGSSTNCFFNADIGETLETWKAQKTMPRLWIHGHTHNHMDYVSRFGFRVYCNPLGYPYEGANPMFWDRIVLDIGEFTP